MGVSAKMGPLQSRCEQLHSEHADLPQVAPSPSSAVQSKPLGLGNTSWCSSCRVVGFQHLTAGLTSSLAVCVRACVRACVCVCVCVRACACVRAQSSQESLVHTSQTTKGSVSTCDVVLTSLPMQCDPGCVSEHHHCQVNSWRCQLGYRQNGRTGPRSARSSGCLITAGGCRTVLAEQAGSSRTETLPAECAAARQSVSPKRKGAGIQRGTGWPAQQQQWGSVPTDSMASEGEGARGGTTVGLSAPETGLHAEHALGVSRPGP